MDILLLQEKNYKFFSLSLSVKATLNIREKYSDNYLKLVEFIFDNHNLDIMIRDFHEIFNEF